jgi:hypothetical protein
MGKCLRIKRFCFILAVIASFVFIQGANVSATAIDIQAAPKVRIPVGQSR